MENRAGPNPPPPSPVKLFINILPLDVAVFTARLSLPLRRINECYNCVIEEEFISLLTQLQKLWQQKSISSRHLILYNWALKSEVECFKVLLCYRDVPGANGPDVDCPDRGVPWSSTLPTGKFRYLKFGHDRFLQHNFSNSKLLWLCGWAENNLSY